MGYQSRKRTYLSPREKNARARRIAGRIIVFALIGAALWVFKNRYAYWAWIETYFY